MLRQLLVSNEKNFVYHFIPRAGASSLKYHLQKYLEGVVPVHKDDVEVHDSPLHKEIRKVARPVADLPNYPNHFKFVVVRNPYDRIISYYYEYIAEDFDKFLEYIDVLRHDWQPKKHDHVIPIRYMMNKTTYYDRIYRLEDNAFEMIQTELNLDPFEDVRFSVSSRLGEQHPLTETQMKNLCDLVEEVYNIDLQTFNYTREDSNYLRRMHYV